MYVECTAKHRWDAGLAARSMPCGGCAATTRSRWTPSTRRCGCPTGFRGGTMPLITYTASNPNKRRLFAPLELRPPVPCAPCGTTPRGMPLVARFEGFCGAMAAGTPPPVPLRAGDRPTGKSVNLTDLGCPTGRRGGSCGWPADQFFISSYLRADDGADDDDPEDAGNPAYVAATASARAARAARSAARGARPARRPTRRPSRKPAAKPARAAARKRGGLAGDRCHRDTLRAGRSGAGRGASRASGRVRGNRPVAGRFRPSGGHRATPGGA